MSRKDKPLDVLPPDGSVNNGKPPEEEKEDEGFTFIPLPGEDDEINPGRPDSTPNGLMPVKGSEWLQDYDPRQELLQDGDEKKEGRSQIDLRSDINDLQVVVFSVARALADDFRIPVLHSLIDNLLRLSVSKGRKSRTEFVNSIKASDQFIGGGNQTSPFEKLR